MLLKKIFLVVLLSCFFSGFSQEKFVFAHISDTHIGGATATEDLELTIADINKNPQIEFVIHTGDVTEFGSDEELYLAKQILDKLNKPYYIVPGNHDSKWSESGCNTFIKVFGSENFAIEKHGYLFIGTASGPNMRMSPGQIPREHLTFLDSIVKNIKDPKMPIININHYPLDKGLANYYEAIDILKTKNIQLHLNGHGHANSTFNFEGIPGIMSRSNLSNSKQTSNSELVAGYNIVTIDNGTITYNERQSGKETLPVWTSLKLENHGFSADAKKYERPNYAENEKQKKVSVHWQKQIASDIGCGIAVTPKLSFIATTKGEVIALETKTGSEIWRVATNAKIFSTPEVSNNTVVFGSTDNKIIALNTQNGKKIWEYATAKSVLSSPTVVNDIVYIGASDGIFRAINIKTGTLIWEFKEVNNFVETKPLVYQNKVFFGSWGNTFYALDQRTGNLVWKSEKSTNRMYSPAAVIPVGADGKVFIVAPDRYMTAFDVATGKELFYSKEYSCRESIGLDSKNKIVYIKTMKEGDLCAFDATSNDQKLISRVKTNLGYEIAPSALVVHKNLVFIPTQNGIVMAIDTNKNEIAWQYKVSNTLINNLVPTKNNEVFGTTMDGKVFCLKYK